MILSLIPAVLVAATIPTQPNALPQNLTHRQLTLVNALAFRETATQPKVMSMRQLPFPKVEANW